MAPHVTVDVVDHPSGGIAAAIWTLGRAALRGIRPSGCAVVIPCMTAHLRPIPLPVFTPRRIALIAVWSGPEAITEGLGRLLGAMSSGAREHWHVRGELARASADGAWRTWTPDAGDAAPLSDDEPLLAIISGELRPRAVPEFLRDNARAVRQAQAQPGYLGGLGLSSSPMNTTSCSAWRTTSDSRAYAFAPGAHADAFGNNRAHDNHSTERFLRIRPYGCEGTVDGRNPFGGLVDRPGKVPSRFGSCK